MRKKRHRKEDTSRFATMKLRKIKYWRTAYEEFYKKKNGRRISKVISICLSLVMVVMLFFGMRQ